MFISITVLSVVVLRFNIEVKAVVEEVLVVNRDHVLGDDVSVLRLTVLWQSEDALLNSLC